MPGQSSNEGARSKERRIKVSVDLDLCQGHGRCYSITPQVFRPHEVDGHAVVDEGTLHEALLPDVLRAVQACPEQAIRTLSEE